MVSYVFSNVEGRQFINVLILVVVDDGLVLACGSIRGMVAEVLILVVVDDGLVRYKKW